MSEPILAWHFLAKDGHTRRAEGYPPSIRVKVGQVLTEERRPLVMCRVGLHASVRALDALHYAPGPVACRVKMGGEGAPSDGHTDKVCYSERTVLAMADASVLLHEFACWCAEQGLLKERAIGREPDPRCWAAIEAKRAWLRGEIGAEELDAAWAAAKDAAWDAAWDAARAAAWDAAWDAARAAARAAAWAAAWDAAKDAAKDAAWDAARAAARAAAWDAQNAELELRLFGLLGI